MRPPRSLLLIAILSAAYAVPGRAQETVFNVPSGDILSTGTIYLESDVYARTWSSPFGPSRSAYLRAVSGLGREVEAGVNVGALDLKAKSDPFIDLTVKWRPSPSIIVGTNAGVGLRGTSRGHARDLAYGAVVLKPGDSGIRLTAGPCYATERVFGAAGPRAMAAIEAPVVGFPGWTLAADWFSGGGGSVTPGVIVSAGSFTFYVAYGFSNDSRGQDLLTIEFGVTLPHH